MKWVLIILVLVFVGRACGRPGELSITAELDLLKRQLETADVMPPEPFELENIQFWLGGGGDGNQLYVGSVRPLKYVEVDVDEVSDLQTGAGRPLTFELLDEPGKYIVLTSRSQASILESVRSRGDAFVVVNVPNTDWRPNEHIRLTRSSVVPVGIAPMETDWKPSERDQILDRIAVLEMLADMPRQRN